MNIQTPSCLLLFISFASLLLSAYCFLRFRSQAAGAFSMMTLALFVYTAAYAAQLASSTLEVIGFWIKIEYLGIPFVGPFWLILAIRLSGKDKILTRPITLALFIIPVITVGMNWTNEWHNLYYARLALDPSNPMRKIALEAGPFYWVYQGFHTACFLSSVYIFFRMYRQAAPSLRKQALVLLLASFFPFFGYAAYLLGFSPWKMDITPFCFLAAIPIFLFGIVRLKIIEILPFARERIFETITDGILVVDAADRIVDFNASAGRMLGFGTGTLGLHASIALAGHPGILRLLAEPRESQGEYAVEGESGLNVEVRIDRLGAKGSAHPGWLLSIRDITNRLRIEEELRQSHEELRLLASTDEMTGAVNRRMGILILEKQMGLARRNGSSLCVCYFDLDGLKRVNDGFGHSAGDELIKAAHSLLSRRLRQSDTIARMGGDEFIVILPECSETEMWGILGRIGTDIAKENGKGTKPYKIRVSYGGAVYSGEEGIDAMRLVSLADERMYEMKRGKS